MSTGLPQNELHSFYEFIGRQLENGGSEMSAEQSLQEFREYQDQLQRFIKGTYESIASGPAKPLDKDELMQEVRDELAKEGIED